jgi:serine/threonine protein kinase
MPELEQTVGQQTVGRYEIIRELGRGGMATVYLARQIELDRAVALKELGALSTFDPSFAKRFLREARLAGSLSHPNIVTVYEYFADGGTPYIAMEYVERGTLRPYVGRMSLAEIGGVLEAVLSALAVAEQRHIVHRDLKPENLLVTADGRVKISDFGIAKATNELRSGAALTSTGVAVGTPNYMAPEQATAQGVGPWTDLYSVGIMAFEFFVGRPPFGDTDNALGVLLRQVNETIPAVNDVDAGIDARISDWIARMVAKEPADRPRSAAVAWDEIDDTFLALLGPRWRRHAALAPLSDISAMPPGPATPPPPGAPIGPLTEAHLGAPFDVYPPGFGLHEESGSERATAPLDDPRQRATIPPRTPAATTPAETPRKKAAGLGRRATKYVMVTAALIAAVAAVLGRTGSANQAPPVSANALPTTTASTTASVAPQVSVRSGTTGTKGTTGKTGKIESTPSRPAALTKEAKGANKLADQYQSSASQVARLQGARVAGSPTARLVTALRRAAAAYRVAASAAAAGDVAGYVAAMQTATARRQEVETATAALRSANSNPTQPTQPPQPAQPNQPAQQVQRTPCSGDSVSDDPSDEGC